MDKTSSTSSSTAAAVADSASAAASSKTTTNNSSASMTATVSATSVKLLIKASNQQFDDQIIESDLLWTVKRLKTQLSLVYPSKPPVADQKLIYSGQLLQDTLQLKDVIRSYKDVYTHNHIFHLVYTPKYVLPPLKSKMPSSMSNNTDGLRQRNVPGSTAQQQKQLPQQQSQQVNAEQQQQQQQQQQPLYTQPQFPLQYTFAPTWTATQLTGTAAAAQACPPFGDPNSGGGSVSGTGNNPTLPFSLPGQFHMQAMATQQAAMYNWMQHVYTQYMDQCARLTNPNAHGLHTANGNTTANSSSGSDTNANVNAASGVGAYGLPPSHPFLQQFPYFIPNPAMPSTTPVIPAFPPIVNNNNNNNVGGVPAASDVQQQQQQQAQAEQLPEQQLQQQQQQQPAAPRFPNIAQDEQDNRDWLDSFFSITRLAIFLTILYFNSSPLRCLVVVIIAGGIYLYHIGVFRLRQERNNNNINRNNNTPLVDHAQRQQREPEANAEAAPVAAAANTEAGNANADGDANPPQNGTDNNSAAAAAAATGDVLDAANDNNNATEPLLPNAGVAAAATANTTSADENNGVVDGDDQNNNANSVISFVRTFVVTFFTSLLPETPAL